MVLPRLLHPVDVELEKLSRGTTIVNDVFREPVQSGNRSQKYTLKAQIKWGFDDKNLPTKLGADSEADGYVLLRSTDLAAAGITIDQGDRFVSFGSGANKRAIDVYVTQVQPMAHYPDQNGPGFIRAWFRDRHPSKQNRGGV